MTPDELRAFPPDRLHELAPLSRALWHDARGDWESAHNIAQEIDTPAGARMHAYLHRREGDAWNAAYWYRRANQPVFTGSLDKEWIALAEACLAH